MQVFSNLDEFAAAEGADLSVTDWMVVDQQRIDTFADATDDHQWIHVDPERAAAGPFGGTIAHGLLTLSLLPVLMHQLYTVEGVSMAVNYGFDKVRFAAPVPVGSKIRAAAVIGTVTRVPGGVQGKVHTTMEVQGSAKPACVIESIVRFVA
ncbi:MaoC family dehydratase [Nocardia seriolae]|uniref:NADPH:quinone reductase n=1 Tax=Nocardia seriolae TaxID=37332 RepID=A0ABC8AUM0_9NOCA|nr:MaoC family dehydratase [Nocardia seriolae]APA98086.1 NADPH:quinone reductase [Nocardia seriolae]OJF84285.1 dehydratase [Nocardia seriolae]QOW37244.1 MaoC family dehydratase [Nocardia seriolae]QUN21799.1 MaoC family dehydratase [Nocardia seriolae]WKY56328.1 MaoC family dehydratase [Nocardia seriolae]